MNPRLKELYYSKIQTDLAKKLSLKKAFLNLVLEKGLEPSHLAALDPKSSVSTNSTTRALLKVILFIRIFQLIDKGFIKTY